MCGRTDPPRDRVELNLIRWALDEGKPLLGVCRGLQMINVAMGGTLYQDVPAEVPGAIEHDYAPGCATESRLMHHLRVDRKSQLRSILGAEEMEVNTLHHQAIKELAPGLAACALAPDGVIEGIEGTADKKQYLVGVQWHPEEMADTSLSMRQLFQSFVQAASSR